MRPHSFKVIFLILPLLLVKGHWASAYSVRNAFDEIAATSHGAGTEKEMVDFLCKLHLSTQLDQPTDAFFNFWQNSIRDFNLFDIYQSHYLSGNQDGFRTVTFHGLALPDKYTITLKNPEAYDHVPLSRLGNFGVEIGLKQHRSNVDHGNAFETRIAACMAMKYFTHDVVSAWLSGMFRVIDPQNINSLDSPVSTLFANITNDARKPVDNYYEAFPAQLRFFNRYAELKSFIQIKTHANQRYTRLELELAPRLPALEKDFRRVHDYFENIKGVFQAWANIQTTDGLNIMTVEANTQTLSLIWRFNTRDGMLIPFDNAGEPDFAREFSLKALDQYAFKAIVSGKVDLYGIRVYSGETKADLRFTRSQDGVDLAVRVTDIPTPEIKGRALGIIPIFLVNILIPSNVEELAHQFVTVMADGHDNQGTGMNLFWDETAPQDAVLKLEAYTDLLDNRFIHFALKVWGKRIQPDPQTIREMARFWGLFFRTMLAGKETVSLKNTGFLHEP